MDTYVLNDCDQHQNMVAVVTLILAAKIEDIDFAIPSLKQLLEFFDVDDITTIFHYADRMSLTELSAAFKKFSKFYVDLEFHIFKTMDFSLVCPTVVSFLSIYNADFVSEQDYINNEFKFESFGDMKESITLRINEVLQVVLLTHDLTNKRPSFLAASIIAATRKSLNIIPIWTNNLEMMTKYSYEHISIMVTGLIDLCIEFENTQKESVEMPPSPDSTMADSGYGSTIDLTSSAEILNYTTPKRIKLEKDSSLKKLKR